ncbi:MAG TPA: hypothetical protein VIZ64_11585 [Dokdonella sp.]
MNASPAPCTVTPWYHVPEMWLVMLLLGAAVIGSISLVVTAVRHPDAHLTVPNDEPRPSRIPPTHSQTAPAPPARPGTTR